MSVYSVAVGRGYVWPDGSIHAEQWVYNIEKARRVRWTCLWRNFRWARIVELDMLRPQMYFAGVNAVRSPL